MKHFKIFALSLAALAMFTCSCKSVSPVAEQPETPYEEDNILQLITRADLDNEINRSSGIVLINFSSYSCSACVVFAKTYAKAAETYAGQEEILFTSFKIDHDPSVMDDFDVEVVPTTLIYSKGQKLKQLTGSGSFEALMKILQDIRKDP